MEDIKRETFEPFIRELLEINKVINLISRETKPEEIFTKHIYDSVKITEFFDFSNVKTLLDIGSGGGIPGIPLAIVLPHLQVTLLDSTGKKMQAAAKIVEALKLKNVSTTIGRTEEKAFDPKFRESFDIVTARAVAELPELLEHAIPFLKIGGYFIAYKSKNYEKELYESKKAQKTLGAELFKTYEYTLLDNSGERVYIIFKKTHPTPKDFPRKVGVPKKTPLK